MERLNGHMISFESNLAGRTSVSCVGSCLVKLSDPMPVE
jgi:hypothetical protein